MKRFTNVKRAFSLVLSLLIIITLSVACGVGDNKSTEGTTTPVQSAADSSQTSEVAQDVHSWERDTSPITLEWYDNTASITHTFDPQTSLVDGIINQKTGVTINFSAPPEESYDKINAMVASNSLPDIVTFSFDPAEPTFGQMQEGGLIYPILELAEQYAPELKENLPQSMVDWYKYKDNKLYGFVSYFYAPEKMEEGFPLYTSAGMVARKDIMDQLGIKAEDFATKAGFKDALKKVKDAQLKAENGKNVVPIYFGTQVSDVIGWVVASMFGAYEEDQDGNLADKYSSPKFLDACKFVNQLYREGLVDIANFTSNMDQVKELATSGGLFAFAGHMGDFRGTAQAIFTETPERKYVPVECIRADDNAVPQFSSQNTNGWTVTCISKNCKNPERAISLLSYLYSDEGKMTVLFGAEGKTYTMVDGKAQFTKEYTDAKKADSAKAIKDYTVEYYYFMMKDPIFERVMKAPAVDEYTKLWDDIRIFFSRYVYADRMFDVYPDSGSDEVASLSQIEEYMQTFIPKIVLAKSEAEVESLWNEMLNHRNELGFQDVMKVNNEKFQANKAKLGVKYALPIYDK